MKSRLSNPHSLAEQREREEVLALRDRRRRLNLRTVVGVGLAIVYYISVHGADLALVVTGLL